ncbi:hypothetical protein PBI_DYLAN_70 [Mycobacterium phage Dylan]|uniref:Uncharacterized protein n=4 Tax=Viruses TaxID=10239 RepID=S5Y894_9CAUD|nr:hypothetical protein PBI_CATDAWG_70 [Mycobacterium phage Catdawg]YP_008530634.1 hypothetical protein PBI_DYLAN_70 [Mycobacterium phage Dylan]YP_009014435.1 hypothetical protein CL96_gp072 [Mycobacterium phage Firecracker]ALA48911.1 hypothetical protein ZAKHE101_69 [Mycobacterium phage Zakhe101]ATW60553.1 hypothetical protein SEA_FAMILTON_71 [Mycobacterium phage Familton]AVI04101.1 hypothetical protein SEA_JANGDYNASTY_70 [Mycobacterium phage JangDynasty]QGJ87392.1 membrane protein [Mycobact
MPERPANPGPVPPNIHLITPAPSEDGGVLRESGLITVVAAMMSVVTLVLVVALLFWADSITSTQWKYLFTFPGGEFSWAAVFGTAAVLMISGLATRRHRVTALGHAVLGVAAGVIAVFYAVAPVLEETMVTFGWYPWLLVLIPSAFGTVIYWRPVRWS